jgi:hypothetical protein
MENINENIAKAAFEKTLQVIILCNDDGLMKLDNPHDRIHSFCSALSIRRSIDKQVMITQSSSERC